MANQKTPNSIQDRVTVSNIPAPVRRSYATYNTLLAKQKSGKKLSLKEQTALHRAGSETLDFERSVKYSRIKNGGKRYDQKYK